MIRLRRLGDRTLVAGQIRPADIGELARVGIGMIVNNRPDGEEPGQPLGRDVQAAAERAGIGYHAIPVAGGIGDAQVKALADALAQSGDGETLLFCRSGQRSALLWALAERSQGKPRAAIEDRLRNAGYDPAPIAHLL